MGERSSSGLRLWNRCRSSALAGFGERAASVVTRQIVALDTLLEVAEGADGKPLSPGGSFDSQAMVALHCAIDRYVLFDFVR